MPFPIADLEALVADAEAALPIAKDAWLHISNIASWLANQIPMFGAPTACPCPPDPVAHLKAFIAAEKANPPAKGAKTTALPPDLWATIAAIIQMILSRLFPQTPAPTP